MLTYYQTVLAALLQNPGAPTSLYSTTDLNRWINQARGQVAGESKAIRYLGTLSTVIGQRNYNFSAISTGSSNGIQGVIHVRSALYSVGSGYQWMRPRPFPWFTLFKLNNPVPVNGPPTTWSQFGQGSAGTGAITGIGTGTMSSGSIYIDPPPDLVYTLTLDCVCYPIQLTGDTDVEAIPYLWTDAVPFFAAYYALLSAQSSTRVADAERMYNYYKEFVTRARNAANPDVNGYIYEQASDPAMINKLGVQKAAGGSR